MIQLFLLRHGKASKNQSDSTDFDRPLNRQGTAQINQLGFMLKNRPAKIDKIVSSSAIRTFQTAQIANYFIGLKAITFEKDLYLASKGIILSKICSIKDSKNLLYVGHNNGISDIASYLTGQKIELSTGELAILEFDFDDWGLVTGGTAKLVERIKPDVYSF